MHHFLLANANYSRWRDTSAISFAIRESLSSFWPFNFGYHTFPPFSALAHWTSLDIFNSLDNWFCALSAIYDADAVSATCDEHFSGIGPCGLSDDTFPSFSELAVGFSRSGYSGHLGIVRNLISYNSFFLLCLPSFLSLSVVSSAERSARMACHCGGGRGTYYYTFNRDPVSDRRTRKFFREVSSFRSFKHGLLAGKWRSTTVTRRRILSMDAREKSRPTIMESAKDKRVPIFVMMPVDAFCIDASGSPRIRKIKALTVSLKALKLAGVHGIGVEVWWGIVERGSPLEYDWSLYEVLFKLISNSGLKMHVALSFHSNVNSSSGKGDISLPLWILEIGNLNKDIYYRDRHGFSNDDYLTLGVDQLPVLSGRTALQCYEDFMSSFVNKFEPLIGTVVEEISVGLGPSGELRYPAHPFNDGRWNFPGIGEFQCYDKYMMEDLKMAACQEGKPQWGNRGPENAGSYNSLPSGVPFFEEGEESFVSDYGRFFLEWYSGRLICHADAILAKAAKILEKYQESNGTAVSLVAKIGGIYWWYQTISHPAELTAGYYNTAMRDGYEPVASVLSRHGAALHIPCLEMMDAETPSKYNCSPEGLLEQIRSVSKKRILHLVGRNTNERFDKTGLRKIHSNCYHPQAEAVRSFTYFRMNEKVFRVENWNNFVPFVRMMSLDL